jgi:hypothetical protein
MGNGYVLGWVVSKWALLGCGSVTVRLRRVIEIVSLKRLSCYLLLVYLRHSC